MLPNTTNDSAPLAFGSTAELGAWVPIYERLPKHNETVLVWRRGVYQRLSPGRLEITQFRLTGDGPMWDCDQIHWPAVPLPTALIRRVTHWMPLPAGPREGA